MVFFSERYGYKKVNDVIIKETITLEIKNTICNWYDELEECLLEEYFELEKHLWIFFLNKRKADLYGLYKPQSVIVPFILDEEQEWYLKLDIIEKTIAFLSKNNYISKEYMLHFIEALNNNFERLHFGYRIIENKIVEINSAEEIYSIENALRNTQSIVKRHLNTALELYAIKPEGDYKNSIKESISAVEAFCREKTDANDLGKALRKMESKGFVIHPELRKGMEKFYHYTNDKRTGIRHALMDETGEYIPSSEEALYMLVTCSVFINYLLVKESKI